jgi:hypothetical protein
LDSVSVRVDELVKDGAKRRRLRRSWILDKLINTNNWQPSDQGATPRSIFNWTDTRASVAEKRRLTPRSSALRQSKMPGSNAARRKTPVEKFRIEEDGWTQAPQLAR